MPRLLFMLIILVAAVPGFGARLQTLPLALIEGEAIEASEFRDVYLRHLLRTGLEDDFQLREQVLAGFIARRLIVREALQMGIAETEAYRHEESAMRRKLLIDRYTFAQVYGPITVTEAEQAEVFVRMNTQLRVRHLYSRTLEDAERLMSRLEAGESFEALARETFADSNLAANGGLLPPFTFDEMDPAFEDAAFNLAVGEVSEPVRTAQGYSILRLEHRETHPVLTQDDFDRKRGQIGTFVRMRKEREARTAFVAARDAALIARFHETELEALFGQITGRALMPADEAMEAWMSRSLVTFGEGDKAQTWTIRDFQHRAQFAGEEVRARVRSLDDLRTFIRALAVQEALLAEAESEGLDSTPAFDADLRRAMDDWVVAQRQAVLARADVPPDSIRTFYERFRADFVRPARVEVSELLVETKATASALYARLSTSSFETLARTHSVRPGADRTGGSLGFLTHKELGRLATSVFEASEGDFVGPVEIAGYYAILRIGAREEARLLRFEEAAPLIHEQLAPAFASRALADHIRSLREQSTISIDLEALAALRLLED